MNTPTQIIVHHTGGTDADPLADSSNFTFDQCNVLHKQKFNFISSLGYYVGYHYFIDKNGLINQGRADTDEGAHTIGQNSNSLGICLAGNFDATLPTQAQVIALTNLLKQKMKQYGITKIVPHRTYANKTCYGKRLSDTWAADLVKQQFEYLGDSLVDYLRFHNLPSNFAYRAKLASQKGIKFYIGTADQNTRLLNILRG